MKKQQEKANLFTKTYHFLMLNRGLFGFDLKNKANSPACGWKY
jgi:hypothetical protein